MTPRELGDLPATEGEWTPLPFESRYGDFEVAGAGGMGVVYAALDRNLHRIVAIKMIRPDTTSERRSPPPTTPIQVGRPEEGSDEASTFADLEARFLHEAWVTGGLEHPGVVPVYDLGATEGGVPYYTMRFLRGQRTLKIAIDELEGAAIEERLGLLEPFLRVCDTMRYAHARGVIHRDLKPGNVVLGEFGEVVVIDWGLARFDAPLGKRPASWQDRLQSLRDAGDLRTLPDALGTPGYMAPEAARGHLDEVGPRSDVYSLGVILFEILTGTLPLAGWRSAPPSDGSTPALMAICHQCLAEDRDARPASVAALSDAIRAWQTATAIDRDVEANVRDARAALRLAGAARGRMRLDHVDHATAALHQATVKRPDRPDLRDLRAKLERAREAGVREQGKANVRRLLLQIGVVALVVVTLASIAVVGVVKEAQMRADRERDAKAAALKQNQVQLEQLRQLSDVEVIRDLEASIEDLTPAHPDLEAKARAWLDAADALAAGRPKHARALAELRARALDAGPPWRFSDQADAWQHGELVDLIERLDLIESRTEGVPRRVQRLHDLAVRMREAEAKNENAWHRAIGAIQAERRYRGLDLRPERGLVPLGKDPKSGLQEFAQLGTGTVPTRNPTTGHLKLGRHAAIVFVLIPGGTFVMGEADPHPHPPPTLDDKRFQESELPAHEVRVPPFFLARHECTAEQWNALTMAEADGPAGEARLPVGGVSWHGATRTLARHGLRLPTEAEWEYACRAGTSTHFWSGSTKADLARVGWVPANAERRVHPVGEKRANPFGLHDVHGNVMELCQDVFVPTYEGAPVDGSARTQPDLGDRAMRGGGVLASAFRARSAFRSRSPVGYAYRDIGFRPARSPRVR